jgi:hypothetical protein
MRWAIREPVCGEESELPCLPEQACQEPFFLLYNIVSHRLNFTYHKFSSCLRNQPLLFIKVLRGENLLRRDRFNQKGPPLISFALSMISSLSKENPSSIVN